MLNGIRKKMLLSLVVILSFLCVNYSLLAAPPGWNIEIIDTPKTFSKLTDRSMIVDNLGIQHIAYGQNGLYYSWGIADSTSSPLFTVNVDPAASVGTDTAIITDSSNVVHISYYDSVAGAIKYATNYSGQWGYQCSRFYW